MVSTRVVICADITCRLVHRCRCAHPVTMAQSSPCLSFPSLMQLYVVGEGGVFRHRHWWSRPAHHHGHMLQNNAAMFLFLRATAGRAEPVWSAGTHQMRPASYSRSGATTWSQGFHVKRQSVAGIGASVIGTSTGAVRTVTSPVSSMQALSPTHAPNCFRTVWT